MGLFDEFLTEGSRASAKRELKDNWSVVHDARRSVENVYKALDYARFALETATEQIKCSNDPSHIRRLKDQFDIAAVAMETFFEDIKKDYETMLAIYTAEKLAGSYDRDNDGDCGVDGCAPSSSSTPTLNNAPGSVVNQIVNIVKAELKQEDE